MSPEERQMLSELFERVRGQANAPRDRDAEALIADAVRAQPYAPYLMAQAVLVQEQALRAADQKLQELQAQVTHLQSQAQAAPQSSGGGSFLGGLFGGGAAAPRPAPQPQQQAPSPWGAASQNQAYAPAPPQAAPGPWGAPPAQGGGFLKGALGAAAGVAGGVLLADSIKGLMGGGHGGLGGGGLFGGGGLGSGGGETVVNNFYDSPSPDDSSDYQDVSDNDDDVGGDSDYGDDV